MSNSLGEAVLDLVADGGQLITDINKAKPGVLGALDGLGKAGGLLLAAGLAVAATALVGITTLIWNAGETIDAAYDKIAISTGATGAELQALQEDFDAVFTSVPANAEDAAAAISGLNQRLGMTGPILQETSEKLLEMTRLTGGDLSTNIEQFTRFMGDAGIANEDASKTLDTLFVASQQTGTGIDRLMQLAVQFGAPMRSFGFSWEESIAMLGKWEKEGVNTELVMGSLRIAAGKFANANKPLKQGLEESFNAIKNAKDGSEALAIAMDVFGAKAGPDMAAAIRENRFELGDMLGTLENTDDAIMKTAASTMDWGERWTLFKNKITVALGPAGMGLMEAVNTALTALEGILARPDIQNGLMMIVNWIVWLAQTAAANLPSVINQFFALVAWLQANQGVVVAILAVLGAAFLAFGITTAIAAWTAISPLLPIVAAIAAIGLAAYLLYTMWTENWYGIQEIVAGFWAWLQPILQSLWNWLATNVPIAIAILKLKWQELQNTIAIVWNWLSTVLFPFFQALRNFLSAVFGVALTALAGIWQNVLAPALKDVFGWLSEKLMPVFKDLSDWWKSTGSPVAQAIAHWFGDVIVQAFKDLTRQFMDATKWLNDMATKLNNMKLPGWMTPGSPTPWEIGLWGVQDALQAVSGIGLPSLSANMGAMAAPALATGSVMNNLSTSGAPVQFVYSPLISTSDQYEAERVLRPFIEKSMRQARKR